jgi:hypothetical protein
MSATQTANAFQLFDSRLVMLEHLIQAGLDHLEETEVAYFQRRLAHDMLPLGTQIAFTCNQPRNFSLWLDGAHADDLNPTVESMAVAKTYIAETRSSLSKHHQASGTLPATKHLPFGPGLYADLTGEDYLSEFLIPNFYFHLVTSYSILRASGVPIGKRDYMFHLLPKITQSAI